MSTLEGSSRRSPGPKKQREQLESCVTVQDSGPRGQACTHKAGLLGGWFRSFVDGNALPAWIQLSYATAHRRAWLSGLEGLLRWGGVMGGRILQDRTVMKGAWTGPVVGGG